MSKEYCPDCIEPLVKDRKKLGRYSVWLICPKCGYRKRPKSFLENAVEKEKFFEYKKQINQNLNNQYEE